MQKIDEEKVVLDKGPEKVVGKNEGEMDKKIEKIHEKIDKVLKRVEKKGGKEDKISKKIKKRAAKMEVGEPDALYRSRL